MHTPKMTMCGIKLNSPNPSQFGQQLKGFADGNFKYIYISFALDNDGDNLHLHNPSTIIQSRARVRCQDILIFTWQYSSIQHTVYT